MRCAGLEGGIVARELAQDSYGVRLSSRVGGHGLTSHNTHFPRRGLRPLATAGELAPPLGEAVDTPSPPLRSALGASENAKRYTPQESQLQTASASRVRIEPSGGIQPSRASARRAPLRSLRQQCPSYSSAPRAPLFDRAGSSGAWQTNSHSRERGSTSASHRHADLIYRRVTPNVAPHSNDRQLTARSRRRRLADALPTPCTADSRPAHQRSAPRRSAQMLSRQSTRRGLGGRIRSSSCIPTKPFRRSSGVSRLWKGHREPQLPSQRSRMAESQR
jgi:hypothetical protein